jgi:hypothetical protein
MEFKNSHLSFRRGCMKIILKMALFLAITSAFIYAAEQGTVNSKKNVLSQTGMKKENSTQERVKNQNSESDTLIIKARLVEIPGKFPPNDLYNYVYIMKYQVISVENGNYSNKEILVGEYNPLISRSQIKDKMDKYVDGNVSKFEIGSLHRLVLIRSIDRIWKDAVEDDYFDSDLQKYFALKTDIVN